MTWPDPLLDSYLADLVEAERVGRNLVTEKYGRMMESTAPQDFHDNIEPYIPRLSDERIATQEHVIATQVAWAEDFRARYPKLGRAMRVLRTAEDTAQSTSFETYLRGELGTYSERTMALYRRFVDDLLRKGRNLTEETIAHTVASQVSPISPKRSRTGLTRESVPCRQGTGKAPIDMSLVMGRSCVARYLCQRPDDAIRISAPPTPRTRWRTSRGDPYRTMRARHWGTSLRTGSPPRRPAA